MEASQEGTAGQDAENAEGVAGENVGQPSGAEAGQPAPGQAGDAPGQGAEGESPAGGETLPASEDEKLSEVDADERNPAADQAPVATEHQEAVIGDPGFRDEQQPVQGEGTPSNVNTPHRTSAPPPEAQSGVPLPEDRAAGVQPGKPVPTPEAPELPGEAEADSEPSGE